MATWGEDSSLADLKSRLEKLRVDQARQAANDEEKVEEIDTLKILEAKFGSPVYDPTSPAQIAYARRCARTGRRQSIEFEDLYLTKGSGRLLHPHHHNRPPPPPAAAGGGVGGVGLKRTPSQTKGSTPGGDPSLHPHHPHHAVLAHERQRKTSDPTAYYKRLEKLASVQESHAGAKKNTAVKTRRISHELGRHPHPQGHGGHEGQGHAGDAR